MMLAPALVTVATFGINIALNAGMIAALGFNGAPVATSLSRVAQLLMLALVVWRVEHKKSKAAAVFASSHDNNLETKAAIMPAEVDDPQEKLRDVVLARVEAESELQPLRRHSLSTLKDPHQLKTAGSGSGGRSGGSSRGVPAGGRSLVFTSDSCPTAPPHPLWERRSVDLEACRRR